MIKDVNSNQALTAAQQTQLFTAFASVADRLELGLAYVNTQTGLRVVGVADTPSSIVNFAGIQYNLPEFTPERVMEIMMTGGQNLDDREDFMQIQRYLENRGGNTPISQFKTRIMEYHRELFDGQTPPIESWSIAEANQVIQHWLQTEGRN